jgi:hypothetical protein
MGNYKMDNISEEDFISIFTRIHNVLNELDIEYWLSFGTLLGYTRDGKQIKGDSDLDFGCTSEAMDILEKNKHLIYEQGFKIVEGKNRDRGRWRGIFIYDENIKNFHIDISEWKYDPESNRYSFRWYIRLNPPSKIFDVLYKIITEQMKKMNDAADKKIYPQNFTRYKKVSILKIISDICFEIDWFFNTKRQLEINIPFLVAVDYYGVKTNISAHPIAFCKANYGKQWFIPDSGFRAKGGSECIRGITEDGFQRCYIND